MLDCGTIVASFARSQPLYVGVHVGIIVFFAFFYRAIVLNPQTTADNLRKKGGLLPGSRPETNTAEQIDYVLTRITVIGAMYLSLMCMLPELLIHAMAPYYFFSGTALVIVVVAMLALLAVARALFRFAP